MQPASKLQLNIWMLNLASVPMHCCCYVLLAIHFYSLISFPPLLCLTSLVLFVIRWSWLWCAFRMEFPLNLKLQANRPNVQRPPTPHQPPSPFNYIAGHFSFVHYCWRFIITTLSNSEFSEWASSSFLVYLCKTKQQKQKEEENKEHWWWWPAEIVFSFNRFKRW